MTPSAAVVMVMTWLLPGMAEPTTVTAFTTAGECAAVADTLSFTLDGSYSRVECRPA